MSIWKSPVFYFGVLLVLLVTAALAAPYVVPWNSYRAELEAYGEKLTGRSVAIDGNIAVRLFPWPMLEARDVAVGNPAGFSDAAFVRADVMRVTLSLGGLFNGRLDVEEVEVEQPIVNLQRNATGDVNWVFAPTEQVVGQGLLSRVKLDKIVLSRGTVSFDDLRNGHSALIGDLNATLSAQSILGPWRMKGQAKWNDVPLGLSVTTNAKTEAEPLKFTVKLEPLDVIYPVVAVEGAWDGAAFDGALRIDPQETNGSKTSAEGALKPLTMQAKIEASSERLSLLNLRIAPADRKDSGTLIEGAVLVEFGSQSVARVDLKSPRINLDTLVGGAALQQWRDGGFLLVSNSLLAKMPAKLVADYSLNVSVLTSGGQALNDVRINGSVQKEAIRVTEFAAELPGRSAARFDGVIFPGEVAAQLGGKLAFESGDFRAFLGWLVPTWKPAFETHWTGSRGRLEVAAATLDWTTRAISLKDVGFTFDGATGKAQFTQVLLPRQGIDLAIDLKSLDIDGLLPNGWSFLRDGGLPGMINMAIQPQDTPQTERHFVLKADAVKLNGVAAQSVAVDMRSHPQGLDIKQFDIGNVGGAQLTGGGVLSDQGSGPEGQLNFTLRADDPRGFLKMSGLAYGRGQWTEHLGQTAIDATVKAVPQKSGPELEIVARGTSGPLNVEVVATAREIEKLQRATLAASGGINSADSAALARLVGVEPVTTVGPGDMTFEFKGSMAEGFVFGTTVKALDTVAQLSGTANPSQPYLGITGQFTAKAVNGQAAVMATGLPFATSVAQPLDMAMSVAAKDGGLQLLDIKAHLAGRRFAGSVGFASDGALQADLETDLLDAKDVLALAFMPFEGNASDPSQGFVSFGDTSLRGEVFLRPLQFDTLSGGSVAEAVIGIGLEAQARQLSITSPGEQGLKADLRLEPQGAASKLSGSLQWPVDLSRYLASEQGDVLVSGQLRLHGDVNALGRSPAAALAALEGKGNYWLSEARLSRMTLGDFARAVVSAGTQDALSAALAKLTTPPGTDVGQRIGNFTISSGEMKLTGMDVKVEDLAVQVNPAIDIAANQVRIETTLVLKSKPDLPAVTMNYAGPVAALGTRAGTSALAAKLGYELLSREMAELERLQKQQQELALREEAQRKEDEKRFADYQATRAELRDQARVRRFQLAQREKAAAKMQAIVDAAIKIGPAQSRIELLRHARRLAVRRAAVKPVQPQP